MPAWHMRQQQAHWVGSGCRPLLCVQASTFLGRMCAHSHVECVEALSTVPARPTTSALTHNKCLTTATRNITRCARNCNMQARATAENLVVVAWEGLPRPHPNSSPECWKSAYRHTATPCPSRLRPFACAPRRAVFVAGHSCQPHPGAHHAAERCTHALARVSNRHAAPAARGLVP